MRKFSKIIYGNSSRDYSRSFARISVENLPSAGFLHFPRKLLKISAVASPKNHLENSRWFPSKTNHGNYFKKIEKILSEFFKCLLFQNTSKDLFENIYRDY